MRQRLGLGRLLIVIGLFLSVTVHFTPAHAATLYLPDEVLVTLTRADDLPAVAARYNLGATPRAQLGQRPSYRMHILDGVAPPVRAAQLAADPRARVVSAEPNYQAELPEGQQRSSWARGDAGMYTTQWVNSILRLPEVHQITRGAGVTVAVLDTGVDRSHPALVDRLLPGYDFVDMDPDPSEVGVYGLDPAYGHGTHVAGLVALVAPEATILPLRVLNRDGVGDVWTLAQALDYAVDPDRDPHTDDGADVVNLSLSTLGPTNLLTELFHLDPCGDEQHDQGHGRGDCRDDRHAPGHGTEPCAADDPGQGHDRGRCADEPHAPGQGQTGRRDVVVVAAAGNSGIAMPEYPAAEHVPERLAVAASTAADTLASFSTYGPWVNVAAPGEDVLSSVPGGGYGSWSGTSMATPLTAGTAALVRAADPTLHAASVVHGIQAFSDKIDSPVDRRIDALAAVRGAAPMPRSMRTPE